MSNREPRYATRWTDALDAKLTKLWGSGLSVMKIGLRLGVSHHAVTGRAHRIGLPGRPSPIRPRAGKPAPTPAPEPQPRAQPLPPGARTLPPLPSEMGQ